MLWIKKSKTIATCTGDALGISKTCTPTVLRNAERYEIRWFESHSKMVVQSASHMHDGGILSCVAKSQLGQDKADVQIDVQGSLKEDCL